MSVCKETTDPAVQFQDSWNRIAAANDEHKEFLSQVERDEYSKLQRTIRQSSDDPKVTNIYLLTPKELIELSSRSRVLAGQVAENLRSALDYIVFHLSERNDKKLNIKQPAFVIADDLASFQSDSRTRLKYLTSNEKSMIEGLQPYHGFEILKVIRDASNRSKYRGLLTLRNSTDTEIVLDSTANELEYKGWWQFPQSGDATVYVKYNRYQVELLGRYDAVVVLKQMIESTKAVVWAFERYLFTGRFPKFEVR